MQCDFPVARSAGNARIMSIALHKCLTSTVLSTVTQHRPATVKRTRLNPLYLTLQAYLQQLEAISVEEHASPAISPTAATASSAAKVPVAAVMRVFRGQGNVKDLILMEQY